MGPWPVPWFRRMESHKLAIKFFLENGSTLRDEELIPVFHRWIQSHALPEHLLVDVADYAHVHHGPGTVLVSHEANLSVDRAEGRHGLLYVRKQPIEGGFAERLRGVVGHALRACALLEQEPALEGRAKFRTDEIVFRINDRLHAPNDAGTFAAVKPELQRFFAELYNGASVELEHRASPLTLFEVRIRASASPGVTALLDRLGAAAPTPAPSR